MAMTLAGFDKNELAAYLGVSQIQAQGLINLQAGVKVEDLSAPELTALQQLSPTSLKPGGGIAWGIQHLFEHPKGSHYHGDFSFSLSALNPANWGSAIERLFTINPQSFTPANIVRSFSAGQVAVYTGGLSVTEPTVLGVPLASSDVNKAGLLDSAYVGANSFGVIRAGDPSIAETGLNKIARLIGGAVSSIATGKALASMLRPVSSVSGGSPLTTYGPPSPTGLFESSQTVLASGLSGGAQSFGGSQVVQVVISVLGRKIGGALLSLLSLDFKGVLQSLEIIPVPNVSGPSTVNPFSSFDGGSSSGGGGGGGSGLGIMSQGKIGQSTFNPVWYVLGGLGLVALLVWVMRRKSV